MRSSLSFLAFLIGGSLLILVVVLGWSLGLGWLLTLFLPFNLFEASVLAMLASAITVTLVTRIFRSVAESMPDDDLLFDAEEDDNPIPMTRFQEGPGGRTWEAWFRYEIANTIYLTLENSPGAIGEMNEKHLQELAIRITDIGVACLKDKSPRAKSLRVSARDLKKQMQAMDLRPYDDAILEASAEAINDELAWPEMENVVRARLWKKPFLTPDPWS